MTGTFSKKKFYVAFWPFYFCAHPFLRCSDLSDLMFTVCRPLLATCPPPCQAICHQCQVSVPTPSFPRTKCGAVALKLSGVVFRHIVSLLVLFVSHGFTSVSHPKFLFCFEAKQAKLGGQFRYFASKGFASFCFSFALKQNSGTP